MKYVKMLGLLAVAAAAMMAFAGTASATLTSPAGTAFAGTISAESSNSALEGSVKISCKKSSVSGKVAKAGDTSGSINTLSFSECANDTVKVLKEGTLAISGSGSVTSSGAEITATIHQSVLGFPITTHCIYATNNTKVGTLEESSSTKATAKLNIGNSSIPEVPTDSSCGNDAVWTGTYTITSPDYLDVD